MAAEAAVGTHWLARVARRAGHASAETAAIPPDASMPEAWGGIAAVCGIPETELAAAVAKHYRLQLAEFTTRDPRALRLVPERLARQHHVFALAEDDRSVFVATANPNDFDAEQAIGFAAGRSPVFRVAPPTAIEAALDAAYAPQPAVSAPPVGGARDAPSAAASPQAEHLVTLLQQARARGAQELILEPGAGAGIARLQADGIVYDLEQVGTTDLNRLQSRVRVLANLGAADKQWPRRRYATLPVGTERWEVRVTTTPTKGAERIGIRFLDTRPPLPLTEIGWSDAITAGLTAALGATSGLILVAIPAGHGLTATIAAMAAHLVAEGRRVVCVGESPEASVPGARVVLADTTHGESVAEFTSVEAEGRDQVLVIAELNDPRTAVHALTATRRGKLVIAGIRASHGTDAIARMRQMAGDAPRLAAELRAVLSQRLLRRLCPSCAVTATPPLTPVESRLTAASTHAPVRRAVGCDACYRSGFTGRFPAAELLLPSPALTKAIHADAEGRAPHRATQVDGAPSVAADALRAADAGLTTLEECERVLGSLWRDEIMARVAPRAIADHPGRTTPSGSGSAAGTPAVPAEGGLPTVLVVDDDPVIQAVVAETLKPFFAVTLASTVAEALTISGGSPFGLIVLDLGLPDGNGRTLLGGWRAGGPQQATPVIVLTGSEDASLEVELMDEGADDYQRKPITPDRFAARCRAAVRRARLR